MCEFGDEKAQERCGVKLSEGLASAMRSAFFAGNPDSLSVVLVKQRLNVRFRVEEEPR